MTLEPSRPRPDALAAWLARWESCDVRWEVVWVRVETLAVIFNADPEETDP